MALTAEKKRPQYREGLTRAYPVLADAKIYQGGLVCVTAAGFASPAADTAGLIFVGFATETVDNTGGANGDLDIVIRRGVDYKVKGSNLAQAQVGQIMVVVDDETVGLAAEATNDIPVGKLVEYESATAGWVRID